MNAGKADLESLVFFPPKNPSAERLGKVIVFFDDILISMKAWRWFRERLPEHYGRGQRFITHVVVKTPNWM